MRNRLQHITIFILIVASLAHAQNSMKFEEKLQLDSCSTHATIYGNIHSRIKLDTQESGISENLWGHALAKTTLNNDELIVNLRELDHFTGLDSIKMTHTKKVFSNPEHWSDKFEPQITTLRLDKPLNLLIVNGDKIVHKTIDSLVGLRYHTAYPFANQSLLSQDGKLVPIVYNIGLETTPHSLVIIVTEKFCNNFDLNAAKVMRTEEKFGPKESQGTLHKISVDLNNNDQLEFLSFYESREPDKWEESETYKFYFTCMNYKGVWYRSSFWEDGQDGPQGF